MGDLPCADRAMEFISWYEHGCKWTDSVIAGVLLGELRRLIVMVRATSPPGSVEAKLFLAHMILLGDKDYALRKIIDHGGQSWSGPDPKGRGYPRTSIDP